MTMLTRWNPYREMLTLQEQMNRLFERPFSAFGTTTMSTFGVDLDLVENDDEFVVKATVPGINQDQLEITLDQNVLTIKGEVSAEEQQEGEQYHLRERQFGRFTRSIQLPVQVDADAIDAHLANGILTVTVPKTEESKPKHIPIGNGHKAIEGETVDTTS